MNADSSSADQEISVPILIVGAGPVGLALALDLGTRNVDCLIIDRLADQSAGINVHPRAAAITPRTMEFCRRWGVADQIRDAGFPRDFAHNEVVCTSIDGYLIAIQEFASMNDREPLPFSPQIRERCPQIWFDPILERALGLHPSVTMRRGWQLASFIDRAEGVVADIDDLITGEKVRVRADYVIGCDGPMSEIRAALGLGVTGKGVLSNSVNAVLDIPDFLSRHDKGPAERYFFIEEQGTWGNLTVIDGQSRWRFTLIGSYASLDLDKLDLEATITRALGPGIDFSVVAVAAWRRRETIADRFKVGRVFLAGDAAHTIPPDLGMGMNVGVGDAVDLGWKLQAVVDGWAGQHLLESYEAERRPVAVEVAAASTHAHEARRDMPINHEHILDEGPEGERARSRVGELVVRTFPDGWNTNGLALGYSYEDSPLCVPDGERRLAGPRSISAYTQSSSPGGRAPHAWLADGQSTLDLFGDGFVMLNFGTADLTDLVMSAGRRGVPLHVVRISDGEIAALYERALVLVRPDGHVAWRGDAPPIDSLKLIDRIRGTDARTDRDRGDARSPAGAQHARQTAMNS